jgi:flagellar hook-basal body complex protein FliE
MINPISTIQPLSVTGLAGPSAPAGSSEGFGKFLQSAMNNVQALNNEASDAVQKFTSGQNQELHTVALSTQRAELAFELGLQVRNKVVSAYQEVMKMQL